MVRASLSRWSGYWMTATRPKLATHRRLDEIDQQLADSVEAIESEEQGGSSLSDVKDQFADL